MVQFIKTNKQTEKSETFRSKLREENNTIWFDSNHNWLLEFYCSISNRIIEIERGKEYNDDEEKNEKREKKSQTWCEITKFLLLSKQFYVPLG